MAELQERDWLALLNGISRLHEQEDPAGLASTMLDVVRQIVACEHSSYDEVDLMTRKTVGFCTDPAVDRRWPELQEAAAAHFDEHPVLHFFKQQPHAGARRLSDFVSPGKFHEGGLYRECYRHIGVDHQLVMRLPGEVGTEVGLALNRSSHDFSERDRRCLNLLRPHLVQAYHQCLTAARLRERMLGSTIAVESMSEGVIVLDENNHLLLCTRRAERQLAAYFPDDTVSAMRLPEALDHWVHFVRSAPVGSRPAGNPLLIDGPEGQLTITAVRNRRPDTWVLCLEEQSVNESIKALRRLGLTRRQAQVLYWVTQGKTNSEIAIVLTMSPRTVQKHLEHVFQHLDVQTRTMATVKAMEAITRRV